MAEEVVVVVTGGMEEVEVDMEGTEGTEEVDMEVTEEEAMGGEEVMEVITIITMDKYVDKC